MTWSQGLKYFELEDSITNKIIENYLFNFSLYGFYRLEKIIKIVAKYYGLPFFNFFGNIIINKITIISNMMINLGVNCISNLNLISITIPSYSKRNGKQS